MTRSIEFVFHVTRNDADYAVLHPISGSSPTMFLDESKAIRMSMQGQFVDPGPDVNFLTDRIRPEVIIDGIAYPLGILLPAKVERSSRRLDTISASRLMTSAGCFRRHQRRPPQPTVPTRNT